MTRKANPTVVGSFVLGAIALVVVGILVFGRGSLFRERPRAVAFFQGDIRGLNVGAPVNFHGVPIGTVTDIRVDLNAQAMEAVIPVYMQFEPESMNISGVSEGVTKGQALLKAAIAKGLHAQLASQSLVTGQLLVELSTDPNEPSHTTGADPSTIEIPTSLSDLQKLKELIERVPLEQISASLLRLLQSTDKVVSSNDIPTILKSLANASENLDKLTGSTRQDLPRLVDNLIETSNSARQTLQTAQGTLGDVSQTFKTSDKLLASNVRDAVVSATAALERANKLLADAGSLVATSSMQRYDIDDILRNLAATTRSLRGFTDEIDRRPNAVILGK